jgi:hypothetical protein
MNRLNALLDGLPRAGVFHNGRELPAYRAIGTAGFYAALMVAVGAALATGRSVAAIAALSCACAATFFGWACVRRWIAGRERLVLLEHVWLALAFSATVLWVAGEPVLPYLDIECIALCVFLAFGRVGCTLAGCCHGQPSSVGIAYGESLVAAGFPAELAGVRLFPVAAVEALGLMGIAVCGGIALPFSPPGRVLAWFLLAYAILRFALESLRGDWRSHLLGLSAPRWMSMAQAGAVLFWLDGRTVRYVLVGLAVALIAALAARTAMDNRRRVLEPRHVSQVRDFVAASRIAGLSEQPAAWTSSLGVTAAVSLTALGPAADAHVSLSIRSTRRDLPLVCALAARAFPELQAESAYFGDSNVLHFVAPAAPGHAVVPFAEVQRKLYGTVVRYLQDGRPGPSFPEADPRREAKPAAAEPPPWCFSPAGVRPLDHGIDHGITAARNPHG